MSTVRVSSDVAFSDAVKRVQSAQGSREAYARMERGGGFKVDVDDELAAFISEQTSFFFATASASGQPYVQHRGGPKGFLRVLDARTLGFADYRGNRQYVSVGNLSENPKVQLLLIDYATRSRVKIWGQASVHDEEELVRELFPLGYGAKPERAVVVHVTAWDANCRQHIPQRFEAEDVRDALARKDERIAELERELAPLRASHA